MRPTDNKRYWQRVAKLYGLVMRDDDPLYRGICARIRPHLQRDMAVLELACGTGQLSFPLSPEVRSWEATDFSEKMIVKANKKPRSEKLHFSVQDATRLPYGGERFDAVVVSNALHIMPEPEKALSEALRVLKPGGLLFAPTIVWGEGGYSRLWKLGLKLSGFKICHAWSCKGFEQFVAEHGFTVREMVFLPDKRTPMCYLSAWKKKT